MSRYALGAAGAAALVMTLCACTLETGEAPRTAARSLALTQSAVPGDGARHVAWADVDGDGDADLLVADSERLLRVLVRGEDGALVEAGAAVGRGDGAGAGFRLAAGDVDRDGDVDVVACGGARPDQGGRTGGSRCRLFVNESDGRGVRFAAAAAREVEQRTAAPSIPLLLDYDRDLDPDLFLLASGPGHHRVLRNDAEDHVPDFARRTGDVLRGGDAAEAAALDADGRTLLVARRDGRVELYLLNPVTGRFDERAAERGLGDVRDARSLVTGDFDGDGNTDVALERRGGTVALFLQGFDGTFEDMGRAAGVHFFNGRLLTAADLDREDGVDLLVARADGTALLLANQGGYDGRPPLFVDATPSDLRLPAAAVAAAVGRVPGECDVALDVAVAGARETVRVVFPDDSAARTLQLGPDDSEGRAAVEHGCVNAGPRGATLLGHLQSSVLRGGPGADTLVARGGTTVLRGGPGADRFVADGFTIIRLPPDEIAPGETIVCRPARPVLVDTPLDRAGLERAGVRFEGCFRESSCDPAEVLGGSEFGHPEDVHCHGVASKVAIGPVTAGDGGDLSVRRAIDFGTLDKLAPFPFVPKNDGPGVGRCAIDADCYAFGLDFCLWVPEVGARQCFPSDEQGTKVVVPNWCDDPYFARERYQELYGQLLLNDEYFVIPIIFWLPRSSAAGPDGSCAVPGTEPAPSVAWWNGKVAEAMDAVHSAYGKWRIVFDYRVRTFTVDADGAFVDEDDPCRTLLVYAANDPAGDWDPNDPNSVEALVTAFPSKYVDGVVNIYLTDGGPYGVGEASSFPWNGSWRGFSVLHGKAGAASHELGHVLGLPHPYDGNLAASGTDPNAESRGSSFNWRPFPDQPTKGLHLCVLDGECAAADAPAGECARAPGAASGFCQNLKADCANGGDHVCDTAWDSRPCFPSDRTFLGRPCEDDADCVHNGGWRGPSGLWKCGINKRCFAFECDDNADCDSGMCLDGRCANTFTSDAPSCCDIHADTDPDHLHNVCYEKRPNGSIVSLDVGGLQGKGWPRTDIAMNYHTNPPRVPRAFTPGQRDQVVCALGYTQAFGPIVHQRQPDGAPCSLLPGANIATYGSVYDNRTISHGACASGVCQLTALSLGTFDFTAAVCVPSACNDGVTGAGEADGDCGGACAQACGYSKDCFGDDDCLSGVCDNDKCQPTCADAVVSGTELGTDEGGSGRDPACGGRGLGETCRFSSDCGDFLYCQGTAECVDGSDCPINDGGLFESACEQDADCPGGVCTSKFAAVCAATACAQDSDCDSGGCHIPTGLCLCTVSAECAPGDACEIVSGLCTKECEDGRCLGRCAPVFVVDP